ncbi:hypothetical protein CH063_03378 [Colletotrichum higginsianum]|uniref:Uncharacterized protein n=1 Tax=Colletotrichum higginsianum (strain IMI 349063) TaxID=759273 RepID=H1VWK0_COLHI|nr:hypothetical protein CH063_03378 [Colletotrichum higginsianum]
METSAKIPRIRHNSRPRRTTNRICLPHIICRPIENPLSCAIHGAGSKRTSLDQNQSYDTARTRVHSAYDAYDVDIGLH